MNTQKDQDLTIKIVVVGDSGVGKTSLIECIKNGPNHLAKNITTGNIMLKLINKQALNMLLKGYT